MTTNQPDCALQLEMTRRLNEAALYCHEHQIDCEIIHDSLAYHADSCTEDEIKTINNILKG